MKLLTWQDLEEKICGIPEFDIDLLKSNTVYRVNIFIIKQKPYTADSPVIGFFWKFIAELSLEEKYDYLKFVWGRSRLPKDSEGFTDRKHTIEKL